MLQFKEIELNDIDIYKHFAKANKELSCERAFVNLLVWQCTYNNMMAVCENQLIIKSGAKGNENFSLPFGDDLEKGIYLINKYCGDKKPKFWVQEGPKLNAFREICNSNYTFTEHRNSFDYIYLRENLAQLQGKKYHSKRNHISAFSKRFNWEYLPITADNIKDVMLCADEWYKEKADRADKYLLCEQQGVKTILNNMERLEVKGAAIYVNGRVVAFTLGSAINDEVFDIHTEKALADFGECYTVINREFAKNALGEYKYINREDDMGLEGLRKAKLSYKPEILLKKYSCHITTA